MFTLLGSTVSCGGINGIPTIIPNITSLIVLIIKTVVPILLIIWGMLDLGKAVMAQKDDDIKKGQKTFVSRLIQAIIVFLVVAVVQLIVGLLAKASGDENETNNITQCIDCFISGADHCSGN